MQAGSNWEATVGKWAAGMQCRAETESKAHKLKAGTSILSGAAIR